METLYFHSDPNKELGRVTVAGVISGDTLRFGAAMCSARDIFFKAKGRKMAAGRAMSKNSLGVIPLKEKPETLSLGHWFVEIAKQMATDVMNKDVIIDNTRVNARLLARLKGRNKNEGEVATYD